MPGQSCSFAYIASSADNFQNYILDLTFPLEYQILKTICLLDIYSWSAIGSWNWTCSKVKLSILFPPESIPVAAFPISWTDAFIPKPELGPSFLRTFLVLTCGTPQFHANWNGLFRAVSTFKLELPRCRIPLVLKIWGRLVSLFSTSNQLLRLICYNL